MDNNVLVALITGGFGLAGVFGARQAGTGKEKRARLRSLEIENRTWDDYAGELRDALRDAGASVPPYPPALRKDAS